MPLLPIKSRAEQQTIVGHVKERFEARARALVYARLTMMAIGLAVLAIPAWRQGFNIPFPQALFWYLGLLVCHVLGFLWVGKKHARPVIFTTLCIDLLVLVYLIVSSGGYDSPLMAAQVVYTVLFALIFPSPLAIVPPLLTLPMVAIVEQVLQRPTHWTSDLLLLLWYTAINVTMVYVVVYLEGREQTALREVFRLQRKRRKKELARQRTRIAREIHDGVGAALSGLLLQAEYLLGQIHTNTLASEMKELKDTATEGMDELRRAVSILHQEFELTTSVPDYVNSYGTRHHLNATAHVRGVEPQLEPEQQLTLFRILQESLSNVARHAQANSVSVVLDFGADTITLQVEDDGRGFDGSLKRGHYGLRNMVDRAAKLGGHLEVTTRATRKATNGTRITLRMPVQYTPRTEQVPIPSVPTGT